MSEDSVVFSASTRNDIVGNHQVPESQSEVIVSENREGLLFIFHTSRSIYEVTRDDVTI